MAPMPTNRTDGGMAALDGNLYALGGYADALGGYAWWSSVGGGDLACAVLEGKLYAVCGEGDGDDALSSVERYDPVMDAWEAVAPTAVARNQPRVPVLDGKLYVVGGYDGDTGNSSSSVERYDILRPRD